MLLAILNVPEKIHGRTKEVFETIGIIAVPYLQLFYNEFVKAGKLIKDKNTHSHGKLVKSRKRDLIVNYPLDLKQITFSIKDTIANRTSAAFLAWLSSKYNLSFSSAFRAALLDDDFSNYISEIISNIDFEVATEINSLKNTVVKRDGHKRLSMKDIVLKAIEVSEKLEDKELYTAAIALLKGRIRIGVKVPGLCKTKDGYVVSSRTKIEKFVLEKMSFYKYVLNVSTYDRVIKRLSKLYNVDEDEIQLAFAMIENAIEKIEKREVRAELNVLYDNLRGFPSDVKAKRKWVKSLYGYYFTDLRRAVPVNEQNFDEVLRAKGYNIKLKEVMEDPEWHLRDHVLKAIKGKYYTNKLSITYLGDYSFINATVELKHHLTREETEELYREIIDNTKPNELEIVPLDGIIIEKAISKFSKVPTIDDIDYVIKRVVSLTC